MGIIFVLLGLAFVVASLTFTAIWSVLSIKEIKEKLGHIDYSINMAFYNDMAQQINHAEEPSAEDEMNLVLFQKELEAQAIALGIEPPYFDRPRGLDS